MRTPSPIIPLESGSKSYFNDLKNFLRKKFGVSENGNLIISQKSLRNKDVIDSSYERLLAERNRLKCAEDIDRFIQLFDTSTEYKTDVDVSPVSLDFLCSLSSLKKSLHVPLKIHRKQSIPNHTVAYIKRKSWKFKYTTQFHFYKDKLFYIHTNFSPSYLSPNLLKKEIFTLFAEKYQIAIPKIEQKGSFSLMDQKGHKIVVSPKVGIDVHYFASSDEITSDLKRIYELDQIEKKRLLKRAKDDFMNFL